MLRLERIGAQATVAMAALALLAFGFFLRDALATRGPTCGSFERPCLQVQMPYSDWQERIINQLRAGGFSDEEISNYIAGVTGPQKSL